VVAVLFKMIGVIWRQTDGEHDQAVWPRDLGKFLLDLLEWPDVSDVRLQSFQFTVTTEIDPSIGE
jgi:hypothetical protein